MNYQSIDWKKAYFEIQKDQHDLVKVYRIEGYGPKTIALQHKILTSFASRAIAVRRVVTNSGGKTPGIDRVLWDTSQKRTNAILELKHFLQNPKEYKAQPVKRVFIPKPGTSEKRPLGIPTMIDRAMQSIHYQSIDPIVEECSDRNSYGFRKNRSALDALAKIRDLSFQDSGAEWVLDADIEKCFDRICHNFILQKIPSQRKDVIEQWLKAGYLQFGSHRIEETDMGTPQGGIISPMLCNLVLNGMEPHLKSFALKLQKRSPKVHVIRYADDVWIPAGTYQMATFVKDELQNFLEPRGLEIKESKTRITHLSNPIHFLGYTIRKKVFDPRFNTPNKQSQRVLLRPNAQKVRIFRKKIKNVFSPQNSLEAIIPQVNPILRGFSNYYNMDYYSVRVIQKLQYSLWMIAWRWARKRHPTRNAEWILKRYIVSTNNRSKHWAVRYPLSNGKSRLTLLHDVSLLSEKKVWPLQTSQNPYTEEGKEYFTNRAIKSALSQERGSLRQSLYKLHNWKCPHCTESLLDTEERIEIHHIKPVKNGGDWRLSNLQPLHETCHKQVTLHTTLKDASQMLRRCFADASHSKKVETVNFMMIYYLFCESLHQYI